MWAEIELGREKVAIYVTLHVPLLEHKSWHAAARSSGSTCETRAIDRNHVHQSCRMLPAVTSFTSIIFYVSWLYITVAHVLQMCCCYAAHLTNNGPHYPEGGTTVHRREVSCQIWTTWVGNRWGCCKILAEVRKCACVSDCTSLYVATWMVVLLRLCIGRSTCQSGWTTVA